jgi:glycosyltransferase involved in cell wall biosynthesis
MSGEPLRIGILTYRGNPRSGGQGVYVRLLSRELAAMGHRVDVWSGQPYPELIGDVGLVEVPSLDLWNEKTYRRVPSLRELADPINATEYASTVTGGFPEPITFCRRVARRFHANGHRHEYDVIHDNQSLGPGLLSLRAKLPVVATIHHPTTMDRRIALESAPDWAHRYGLARWYTFLGTQKRVSRRLDRVMTVSEASSEDLHRDYGIARDRLRNVGNGIAVDVFRPYPEIERKSDRLITTLSADQPLKGFPFLVEALAILRRDRPSVELTVIGAPGMKTDTRERVERLGLEGAIHFTGKVEAEEIARRYAESTVAVVSSLYEGFGFPAGEAMACEVPVVSTAAGALPEVVGRDGECGILVEPGSAESLARGIAELLDTPEERRRAMGAAGRRRVLDQFTWRRAAERTVEVYREAIAERSSLPC